jgi:anti-sigma regulatory factor (Ser/Thr protein kinase)
VFPLRVGSFRLTPTSRFGIQDASQVAETRRKIVRLASGLDFNSVDLGHVALVVTEAATNLLKHTGGGEILADTSFGGLDVLSLDKGAGMQDVAQCLEDGYSTAGSPGTGLGAIRRLSSVFQIHSLPTKGTAMLCRFLPRSMKAARRPELLHYRTISIPKDGEQISGDDWSCVQSPDSATILVADGLGHGPQAAEAARHAPEVLARRPELPPADLVDCIHAASRGSRGSALGVARVDGETRKISFVGVGNIGGGVISRAGCKQFLSLPGIVGMQMHKVQTFDYAWPVDSLLVMVSDGISTQWSLSGYRDLSGCDPLLIAGLLYRDFTRGRDDVTVVVARESKTTK